MRRCQISTPRAKPPTPPISRKAKPSKVRNPEEESREPTVEAPLRPTLSEPKNRVAAATRFFYVFFTFNNVIVIGQTPGDTMDKDTYRGNDPDEVLDKSIDRDSNYDPEKGTAAGAIGGAAVGAAAGSLAGPPGMVLGAAVGAITGAVAAGGAVSEIDTEYKEDEAVLPDGERHIMTEADMHMRPPIEEVQREPAQHGIDDNPNDDPQKGGMLGGVGGAVVGGIAGAAAGPVGVIGGAIAGAVAGSVATAAAVNEVNKHDDDDTVTGVHIHDQPKEDRLAQEDAERRGAPIAPDGLRERT